jgi:hypothetical protein
MVEVPLLVRREELHTKLLDELRRGERERRRGEEREKRGRG